MFVGYIWFDHRASLLRLRPFLTDRRRQRHAATIPHPQNTTMAIIISIIDNAVFHF